MKKHTLRQLFWNEFCYHAFYWPDYGSFAAYDALRPRCSVLRFRSIPKALFGASVYTISKMLHPGPLTVGWNEHEVQKALIGRLKGSVHLRGGSNA